MELMYRELPISTKTEIPKKIKLQNLIKTKKVKATYRTLFKKLKKNTDSPLSPKY
jgi:hypothetical protein